MTTSQPSPVPASFLPPPRRKTKSFVDEPLMDAPASRTTRAQRLAALEAEALADNPNCGRDVPWQPTKKRK